jgi:hypothetical protein
MWKAGSLRLSIETKNPNLENETCGIAPLSQLNLRNHWLRFARATFVSHPYSKYKAVGRNFHDIFRIDTIATIMLIAKTITHAAFSESKFTRLNCPNFMSIVLETISGGMLRRNLIHNHMNPANTDALREIKIILII